MSKVVIQGNASGTGNFTIAAPNSNTDRTFNLPDEAGTVVTTAGLPSGLITASDLPSGSVLQVLSTTKTDTFSSSSSSWTDITGLSVSITPNSTSSKVLVMYSVVTSENNQSFPILRLVRDSTAIASGDSYASSKLGTTVAYGGGQVNTITTQSTQYLDSPSTTSATTYKVQIIATASVAHYINRNQRDDGYYYEPRTVSSITVMEIAG